MRRVRAVMRDDEHRDGRMGDVDLEHGALLVRRALSGGEVLSPKSGDERVVPLTPELMLRLRTVIDGKRHDVRLVLNDGCETPARQDVLRRFKLLLRRAGLKERSFHSLRHSFLSRLREPEGLVLSLGHPGDQLGTERRVVRVGPCFTVVPDEVVGARGFEPPTPWSRTRCATRLRYAP